MEPKVDAGSARFDVASTIGRALRRPRTYAGIAKEMALTGLNVAMYPVGIASEVLHLDDAVRLEDRFSAALPLRYVDPVAAATPIILVHGYFHNRSAFMRMRRWLTRIGFRTVEGWNYNAIGHDIPELAQQLADHVFEVLFQTGATRVNLIGHSLGGLIARYYVQELKGDQKVATCITLGTPHQGTHAAAFGRAKISRQLVPNSPVIRQLAASAREMPTAFVSYYSNIDSLILPARNGMIAEPALRARNVLIKDQGHLSLLMSRRVLRDIVDTLTAQTDHRTST